MDYKGDDESAAAEQQVCSDGTCAESAVSVTGNFKSEAERQQWAVMFPQFRRGIVDNGAV